MRGEREGQVDIYVPGQEKMPLLPGIALSFCAALSGLALTRSLHLTPISIHLAVLAQPSLGHFCSHFPASAFPFSHVCHMTSGFHPAISFHACIHFHITDPHLCRITPNFRQPSSLILLSESPLTSNPYWQNSLLPSIVNLLLYPPYTPL